MLRLEPPRLHPIPADLHIAPSPRMVLARIQKKPPALRIPTFTQQVHLVRSHQLRNTQRKHPQRQLRQCRGLRQLPRKLVSSPKQMLRFPRHSEKPLQCLHGRWRRIIPLQRRIQNLCGSLPQLPNRCNNLRCLALTYISNQAPSKCIIYEAGLLHKVR